MIDINKKYRTRYGTPVELLTINGRGDFPVIGYVGGAKNFYCWDIEGNYLTVGEEHPLDLVEACPFEHLKVDDKIMVSDDGVFWSYRHFAKVLYGVVYTFDNGKTSWSTKDKGGTLVPWKYVKDENGIELI